jgi:tetratricopeptide (TPR) repeat protein
LRADLAGRFLSATWIQGWLLGLLLVLATILAYQPVWHSGFQWDDDRHLINNRMLVEPGGLRHIWTSLDSPQYYPLVFTSFRLERALWGLNPAGYHWVNLLLHAASAVWVWRVLCRLNVPGAWLAAAMFALHPVNVETVAWITERKNTLSMFFFLLSLLLYLRSDQPAQVPSLKSKVSSQESGGTSQNRPSRSTSHASRFTFHALFPLPPSLFYWLSLGAFALALLSKTAVTPLPLVLLLLAWWRRGRVTSRDVWRSAPFFTASLVLGLVTVLFEHRQNVFEIVRDDSFWSRLAVAGRAVWFYLYKAVLPLNLMPIYPRWRIDATKVWSYVPGLLVVGAFLLCWRCRRSWGKAGFLCLGYFVAMLLPVLGFVEVGFMKYSLVADHWQYFSIIGPIALASAGITLATGKIKTPESAVQRATSPSPRPSPHQIGRARSLLGATLCGAMLVALGGLTRRQCAIYTDSETFWRATLAANPACWRAHYVFADTLSEQGRLDEAIAQYQTALEIQPDFAYAHNNLGNALRQKGQVPEALAQYRKALELQPDLAWANCNLGAIFLEQGQLDEAIAQFQRALHTALLMSNNPMFAPAALAQIHFLLGRALARKGLVAGALAPERGEAVDAGDDLARKRLVDEAITHYREALALQPGLAEAHDELGGVLFQKRQTSEALAHFRKALELRPDSAAACDSLAWALATSPEHSDRNGAEAVALARRAEQLSQGKNPRVLRTLAAAYAETGQFPEAVTTALRAQQLAAALNNAALTNKLDADITLYQLRSPFRDGRIP